MTTTREIAGGTRSGLGGGRRRAPRLLAGMALVFVVLLVNGCHGCSSRKWKAKLGLVELCRRDADCKQICPQGNACMDPSVESDGIYGICICRDLGFAPCTTALDCPSGPTATCSGHFIWDCMHHPGSSVGSCECNATCAADLDCKPTARCPEGTVC